MEGFKCFFVWGLFFEGEYFFCVWFVVYCDIFVDLVNGLSFCEGFSSMVGFCVVGFW